MEAAAQWFEKAAGDREAFAFELRLGSDPDATGPEDEALRASWGQWALWVAGHNLTEHTAFGEQRRAVEWYTLPLLEWLAEGWDRLLHEGRTPVRSTAQAADAMEEEADRLTLEDGERFDRWQQWWSVHCVQAAAEGGLFPNLYLRRRRGRIELSWRSGEMTSAPEGFSFSDPAGAELAEPDAVASPLWEVLDEASAALAERAPESARVESLLQKVRALRAPERKERRLALMAGLGERLEETVERWQKVVHTGPADATEQERKAAFEAPGTDLAITGSPVAALMFGSVAPNVSDEDCGRIAAMILQAYAPDHRGSKELTALVDEQPLLRETEQAWAQGYRLAEHVHEQLAIDTESLINVADVVDRLEIKRERIDLSDTEVRGLSLASDEHQPTIALNSGFGRGDTGGVARFTLAHELCHLLFDREHGLTLAIASGPWAPRDIEQRANAFAAMFLMPRALVRKVVSQVSKPLERQDGMKQAIDKLKMPVSTAIHHLTNLGYLDTHARDRLLELFTIPSARYGPLGILGGKHSD